MRHMRTTSHLVLAILVSAVVVGGCRSESDNRYQPVVKTKSVSQQANPRFNPSSPDATVPQFITVETYEYGAFDTVNGIVKGPN